MGSNVAAGVTNHKPPTLREQLEARKAQTAGDNEMVSKALKALDDYPGVEELIKFIVVGYGR